MSDPKLELVSVQRIWLERLLAAAVKYGPHMEYDSPGDVPEPCGMWCDICNQHVDDDAPANGHKLDCPIDVVGRLLSK